jgi:hypothetical protein
MSIATSEADTYVDAIEILSRLLGDDNNTMSVAAARFFLKIGFSPEEQARVSNLLELNRQGAITSAQHDELQAISTANTLLAILQSKARQTLKRAPRTRRAKR